MKNLTLPFNKVSNPVNYNLIEKLRSYTNFICSESNSQLLKRLDSQEAENILSDLKKGIEITLK